MTESVQEGAPVTPEPVEPAVPEVSEVIEEVQQPSVPDTGLTESRLEQLLAAQDERFEAMEERLERAAQSAKDRGISKNAQEIAAIRGQLESLGGDWGALQAQAETQSLYDRIAQLESGGTSSPAPAPIAQVWQEEWASESQKIQDAAAKRGVNLAPEEYNAAMFNNGVAFKTKGDAYAALNNAIIAKAQGEAIPVAAVATEGGDVAAPPAPPAEPKAFRQQLDEAIASGDIAKQDEIMANRWKEFEDLQEKEAALAQLKAAGISPEDLIE